MAKFPLETWKADVVRVTLFSPMPWQDSPESIFQMLMSAPAEGTSSKPNTGEASAAGAWGDYLFDVRKTINRLDLLIKPKPAMSPDIPLISNPAACLADLSRKVGIWAGKQDQKIIRVAAGCGAMWPVTSMTAANSSAAELTGVFKTSMEEYSELEIQLNRPYKSKIDGNPLINRLAKSFGLKVEAGISVAGTNLPVSQLFFAAFVTDVNTDAARVEPFDRSLIPALLDELANKSNEMLLLGGP